MTAVLPRIGRLVGPPVRVSPNPGTQWDRPRDGWIKLRLCHARGRSYLLPDVLIGFGGTRFFRPSFFGPPRLVFDVPSTPNRFGPKHHQGTFDLDVAAPRATKSTRVIVTVRSDHHVLSYEDGAQLYQCTYVAPHAARLANQVAGRCKRLGDSDFALEVFHHTTEHNAKLILSSHEIWSSARNLAGTDDLENVGFLYFTTLSAISDEADLMRIAMSSARSIGFQTTSDRPQELAIDLPVYEGRLDARQVALAFDVPCRVVAPAHLLHHPLTNAEPSYYEVIAPEIVRVAVQPSVVGQIDGRRIMVPSDGLKDFGYVVEGNASNTDGLVEPMKEGGGTGMAHIERLDGDLTAFEFWKANANRDLISDRKVEPRILRDSL